MPPKKGKGKAMAAPAEPRMTRKRARESLESVDSNKNDPKRRKNNEEDQQDESMTDAPLPTNPPDVDGNAPPEPEQPIEPPQPVPESSQDNSANPPPDDSGIRTPQTEGGFDPDDEVASTALDRLSIQDDDHLPLTPAKPKVLLPSGKAPRASAQKAKATKPAKTMKAPKPKAPTTGKAKGKKYVEGDLECLPIDQVPGHTAPSWIRTYRTFEALQCTMDVSPEDSADVFQKWTKLGHPPQLKVAYAWKAEATHPNIIAAYTQFKSTLNFQCYMQCVGTYTFHFTFHSRAGCGDETASR